MKKITFILFLVMFGLVCSGFSSDYVMFNYQGRVKVQGQLFDGSGQFKFAIVNNAGSTTLWSNDMTGSGGNEPSDSISVQVNDGIFNVTIGDPALGMEPINRTVFNNPNQIKLRTWFSDGTHGFQHLLPDKKLHNVDLIGMLSGDDNFTIYVNSASGDDENNGLTTDTAKKTIQAAWDSLPVFINCDVIIQLADGIYREEVLLSGKVVNKNNTVTIKGDEASPTDVRVTGSDAGADTTPVRSYCFHALSQKGVTIAGMLIDYTPEIATSPRSYSSNGSGIYIENGSNINIRNCEIANHWAGIISVSRSGIQIESTDISLCTKYGVYCSDSYGRIDYSNIHDLNIGIFTARNGTFTVQSCQFSEYNTACWPTFLSTLTFYSPFSNMIHKDASVIGINAKYNSIVTYANDYVNYSGPGIDTSASDGAIFYH